MYHSVFAGEYSQAIRLRSIDLIFWQKANCIMSDFTKFLLPDRLILFTIIIGIINCPHSNKKKHINMEKDLSLIYKFHFPW